MKIGNYITIILLCFVELGVAQNTDTILYKKNALYLEILGNGGTYSINYEGILTKSPRHGFFTLRIGASLPELEFPILINHVSGHQNHHFEVGVGLRLSPIYTFPDGGIITANIMYRFQKPNGKFLFRVGWTPIFYNPTDQAGLLNYWCGLSVGYLI